MASKLQPKKNASPKTDDLDEARPLSDDSAPEATPVAEEVPDVTPAAPARSKSPVAVPRVDVSQVDREEEVLVTMYETIEPAPRVGTFSIPLQLGIAKLEGRKNYRLPKFVAEVLVDAKKAEYLQVN